MSANPEIPNSSHIGRYQCDRVLGEGAAGIVRRAYDPLMDRTVAIKSVRAERLSEEEVKDMIAEFHHEASIAGKYAHENIVTIYDIVSHEGLDHIVMEYVAGRSITEYLKSVGPMPPQTVLSIIYKAAVGLAYIHYHGVIHRDIKPGNILYHHAGDLVKIMDFSIAHEIHTQGIREAGTLAYMAPEHFDQSRRISTLTDVFALGATMYRMLVKKYPFTRENTIEQIMHAHPVPVAELQPEIPRPIGQLVERAMAKEDQDRYQSAAEFAHDIERVMGQVYPGTHIASEFDNYMTI